MSAVTGIAFLPDIGIAEQNLPGGLKVFRVYGGTFYGELFFLGFIYHMDYQKIPCSTRLFLAILFIRSAHSCFRQICMGIFFTLTISYHYDDLVCASRRGNSGAALRQIVMVA
jgi:hypothetical protein